MLAILIGLVFIVCGLMGIVHWFPDVMTIVRGMVPGLLCCGGVLAVIAGIASIRDDMEAKALKKNPPVEPPQK